MKKFAYSDVAQRRTALQLSPIATGCALLLSVLAGQAYAQQAPAADPAQPAGEQPAVQTVQVTGIRRGIEAAIDVKKNASSIVESISAEDIGKLPDTTIAESLARLPGVTSQRTKEGAASNVSIRGLGPDFNGYLLNGREQTSTGDSRAVDLSVYPAELIAGATVYKTSDASLVSAGLAGTIDQQLIDPLAFGKRVLTAQYQKIRNGVGLEVQGRGYRESLTYIDQFADRKLGLAIGFVRADGHSSTFERGNWGSSTVNATTSGGQVIPNTKVPDFGNGISMQTNDTTDKRTGVATILAYRPSRTFNSQLDLFYSKLDFATKKNAVKAGLGGPITNATVSGGVATAGTFALGASPNGLIDYVENVFDNDKIQSAGWRNTWKFQEGWQAVLDLNHNSAERVERDIEYYAGIAGADTLSFTMAGSDPKFTLGNAAAYTDPTKIAIRDQTGWSGINGVPQAGYSKGPTVKDKVDAVRLDFKHDLPDGMAFSNVVFGANYTDRSKDRITDEGLIVPSGSASDRVAFPSDAYVYNNVGNTGLNLLTFTPTIAFVPGTQLLRKYNDDILSKTWSVFEKVTTFYVKGNLDTTWGGIPITGNVGAQVVHTDQSSAGFRAGVTSSVTLNNPAGSLTTAGTTFNDILPSANITGDFGDGKLLRFGASIQIARPTLTDMRNSFAAGVDTNPGNATFGHLVGSAGNPYLKPFKAKSLDLSYEKYFGRKGYVSAAIFYKKLDTYITSATDTNYDFTAAAQALGLSTPPGGYHGTYTTTVNGNGGNLRGYELTASVPFDMATEWLSGFGANGSYSGTSSSVSLPDLTGLNPNQQVPTGGTPMPLPGLSKTNAKLTLYYDKNGFSAFVAKNYRSRYVGSVANDTVGGYPSLRYIEGSAWVSAQIGYEFQSGWFKGLSLRVEGNNLNSPVYRETKANGDEVNKTQTGRTLVFQVQYKAPF
ncbi:MAG: TonB-dependent receptor [Telluria sp.]